MDKFKGHSWIYVIDLMRRIGWSVVRNDDKAKILLKGNLRMAAVKVSKYDWKLEIFENGRIVEGLGINDDTGTKILMCEFGALWGVPA